MRKSKFNSQLQENSIAVFDAAPCCPAFFAEALLPAPVEAFKRHGPDFIAGDKLEDLVAAMNKRPGNNLLRLDEVGMQIEARDRGRNAGRAAAKAVV